jgi:pantothenate kinase type III
MMLLVDAGNTRIKWRIVEDHQLIATGVTRTVDWVELNAAWQPFKPAQAVLSCCSSAVLRRIGCWLSANGMGC